MREQMDPPWFNERAECRLTSAWCALERPLSGRNGILPAGPGFRRRYWLPVALGGAIDRNGDAGCLVGGDGTRERGDEAGGERAHKTSCRKTLAHGRPRGCPSGTRMSLPLVKVTLD